ncbi:sigma-54-dependent Fis family transcriptional regulator [Candidatus Methylospira mobilis]|uniref:Sigma-54-dependent Fis family transcriptional regulator n=1 Tax=Candidatus Methylospira mobilis TaxID=1808979 RepID=A0A5Q0BGU3_9GAMM|nr:sigma 54-interacting transcriptional regulator [Candidatus Methylospira mobilis]QFY43085.1 sigma-54-dependent Fis family transcriptional regulator [Candidatus Methylospira mobilis]WNV03771.1 sigma 54-interacting transcriptional regulator [Candidatus Methylospira mobilis]
MVSMQVSPVSRSLVDDCSPSVSETGVSHLDGFLKTFNLLERPRQAWEWMRQTLQVPAPDEWVRDEVARSWRRCIEDYQLSSSMDVPVSELKKQHYPVDEIIAPDATTGMVACFQRAVASLFLNDGLMLYLADSRGQVLSTFGRPFDDYTRGSQLTRHVVSWNEQMMGNNGIGSSILCGKPAAFCGEEHFLRLLHPFATAGYPLFGADGKLEWGLGILSDQRVDPGILKTMTVLVGGGIQRDFLDAQAAGIASKKPASSSANLRLQQSNAVATEVCHCEGAAGDETLERVVRLQKHRIPVLVIGESGAGKEHFVRKAYEQGPRASGPFIPVNCASIPRDLIESELFGYASGSFTGARREGKPGKFQLADKGVLFLDEIGDMSLDMQSTLLRVLENSEFYPVGATAPVRVDVQVFAATNVPIGEAVKAGRFRRDLYYRLNGMQVVLPPLRSREDKRALMDEVLRREIMRSNLPGNLFLGDEVIALFMRHSWPGNVRQLSNVIRCAAIIAGEGVIGLRHLPGDFIAEIETGSQGIEICMPALGPVPPEDDDGMSSRYASGSLIAHEKKAILSALQIAENNITRAARQLGITRATLYKKMTQYGIKA